LHKHGKLVGRGANPFRRYVLCERLLCEGVDRGCLPSNNNDEKGKKKPRNSKVRRADIRRDVFINSDAFTKKSSRTSALRRRTTPGDWLSPSAERTSHDCGKALHRKWKAALRVTGSPKMDSSRAIARIVCYETAFFTRSYSPFHGARRIAQGCSSAGAGHRFERQRFPNGVADRSRRQAIRPAVLARPEEEVHCGTARSPYSTIAFGGNTQYEIRFATRNTFCHDRRRPLAEKETTPADQQNAPLAAAMRYSSGTPRSCIASTVSSGQALGWTSPMCAFRRRNIATRDCPIPPPTESGSVPSRIRSR